MCPKSFEEFPTLELIKYSCHHDTIAQITCTLTSICFSVPGYETLTILLKFSWFSDQISGFSADFHRKSLDIVKQYPNNAEIDIGEHIKVRTVRFGKNWGLENGKKSEFWRSKK